MKQKKPKPIYGVTIVDFRYSHTYVPAAKRLNPYASQPKRAPKPSPPTYMWVMTYKSPAPPEEKQKDEIRNAVLNNIQAQGYLIKSSKYLKSDNPWLYLQLKTFDKQIIVFEIKRVR